MIEHQVLLHAQLVEGILNADRVSEQVLNLSRLTPGEFTSTPLQFECEMKVTRCGACVEEDDAHSQSSVYIRSFECQRTLPQFAEDRKFRNAGVNSVDRHNFRELDRTTVLVRSDHINGVCDREIIVG